MNAEQMKLSIELNEVFPIYQEYYDELIEFYKDYFPSTDDLKSFLKTIFSFKHDAKTNLNIPRLMLNNTKRLVKLAEDMEKIRPGKDALKITYITTCIETLYNISGRTTDEKGDKLNKATTVIDFFETYILDDDKKYILKKVKRSLADSSFKSDKTFSQEITIRIFALIINETRNVFMHEGDYWTYSLSSMGCTELKLMNVEETRHNGKEERVYEFQLKYEDLHQICTNGFINFMKRYIENNN